MNETIDDKIFEFVYIAAMRDATQQRAFSANNKKLLWDRQNGEGAEVTDARQQIKNLLKDYIDSILNTDVDNAPIGFNMLAENVKNAVNDLIKEAKITGAEFTFGNAQKLINMTAKYMFIATYDNETLRKRFERCHCPMDGIMIEKIITMLENRDDIRSKFGLRKRDWKTELRTPTWSNIDKPEEGYDRFQSIVNSLRDDKSTLEKFGAHKPLSRLEFDYFVWTTETIKNGDD